MNNPTSEVMQWFSVRGLVLMLALLSTTQALVPDLIRNTLE